MLESTFHCDATHYDRPLHSVPLTAFFGGVATTAATPPLVPLPAAAAASTEVPQNLAAGEAGMQAVPGTPNNASHPQGVKPLLPRHRQGGVFEASLYAAMAALAAAGAAASWMAAAG